MKKLILILPIILIAIYYLVVNPKQAQDDILTTTTKEVQKASIESSSTPLVENNTLKKTVDTPEVLSEKKVLIKKLLKDLSNAKLNQTFENAFKNKKFNEQSPEKKEKLLELVRNFPFQEKLEKSYENLSLDELEAIAEIQDSETSKKLQENAQQTQEKIVDHITNGKNYELPEDKKELVNGIIDEASLLEQSTASSKSLIQAMMIHTEQEKSPTLNINEVVSNAQKQTDAILAAQGKNIKMALDMSYDSLSKEELESHLHMLQKIDAKKAYQAALKASNSVYKEFMIEFLKVMK
ncbi:hypothetical protein M902_0382 [Bacteriovorax sp. BAL6_X]|uniref:hypothetical protein n=1 Tax=Bacteriovorax sp. BAL6_X TaxID=1201290 RepID=UPI000386B461|nr:hypothetical protein [Bacteriovorax sp. BAL6_X]EPZ49938.1 hypothetical protein M902_0382 [Bacteriovorax sp. BAL6_X]